MSDKLLKVSKRHNFTYPFKDKSHNLMAWRGANNFYCFAKNYKVIYEMPKKSKFDPRKFFVKGGGRNFFDKLQGGRKIFKKFEGGAKSFFKKVEGGAKCFFKKVEGQISELSSNLFGMSACVHRTFVKLLQQTSTCQTSTYQV